MSKRFLIVIIVISIFGNTFSALAGPPDEGMWLPLYLRQLNEKDMKKLGMKLHADDIYSINHSSLKDAVVSLGGFCTGEIVSPEGLMLTNHHCGYERIAEHSTVDHNYLQDGFWAKNKSEELPNSELTASILVYMKDVTEVMQNGLRNFTMDEIRQVREDLIKDSIIKAATAGNHYKAEVKSFFKGAEYYLMVYEVFQDVRLVGAPPAGIGKFGGDVDNWMWPRHTGDFSVFRIYTGPDGNPAPYSADNIPYKPKYFFTISLKGESANDFTMVMGFPGSTDRYLTSHDLELARDYSNPAIIEAFGTQLDIMKSDMDADPKLKIELAPDYASMSNTYKYYLGQERLLKQSNVVEVKRKQEEDFKKWATGMTQEDRSKYIEVISKTTTAIDNYKQIEPALSYFFYGFFNSGSIKYVFNYFPFYKASQGKIPSKQELDTLAKGIDPHKYLSSIGFSTDKKILKSVLAMMYKKIPADMRPKFLVDIVNANGGKDSVDVIFSKYVDEAYAKSTIMNESKAQSFLKKLSVKKLNKDPMYKLMSSMITYYATQLAPVYQSQTTLLDRYHKTYLEGLRKWQNNKTFYPDANSTLRVTYGQVLPYFPRDGVFYKYYTTYAGILEKENPNDPEFTAPKKEIDLLKAKNFGKYAQNDTLRINFISNNDITGGNSGSPVLDANGRLIGLAFDGDWEAMIGDLYVNPALNRTICVDIRYVMWVMDIYAHADNLIGEMKFEQ